MKLDVYNIKGKKLDQQAELPAAIFEAPINNDLMHQAYTRQMANGRAGTHSTKTRSEVSGGGRKPWRQKGTGNARQGSTRAPQWVGGGKVHTPKPRDYSQDMPKKMRQAALRSALSAKAAGNEIVLVDSFGLDQPKTKLVAEAVNNLAGEGTALLVLSRKDENYANVLRAGRNLPVFKALLANYINIRDLLGYDKLILPLDSIKAIESLLGK
ncbi:MAG TPA: 50S ribosomal protein L4 [Anaerolineales bacterium]|nr:50S ribosomal protein L4 [Anaerolineales bacterium]